MFLQVSVCPRGEGCLPQCMLGRQTPLDQAHPPDQAHHPPGADPPGTDPPRPDPPGADPPRSGPPPDSSIRSTSGRYASYWNAFLFIL